MADLGVFIQQLQVLQTTNYFTALTFSREASAPDICSIPQFLIIATQVDCIWINMEESTVELYDRLIPHCPLFWISRNDIPVCPYLSLIAIGSGLAAWDMNINWTYS
ncbi:hypothetical protein BJ138DRAFT_1105435, partial [Hygrophoropsis aurantiaca]